MAKLHGQPVHKGRWQEFTSADDTSGGISSPEESLYEEVQVQEEEVEYTEVSDWESDMKAIHYWRPFEETLARKAVGQDRRGKC